jgi:hypothetical protein
MSGRRAGSYSLPTPDNTIAMTPGELRGWRVPCRCSFRPAPPARSSLGRSPYCSVTTTPGPPASPFPSPHPAGFADPHGTTAVAANSRSAPREAAISTNVVQFQRSVVAKNIGDTSAPRGCSLDAPAVMGP